MPKIMASTTKELIDKIKALVEGDIDDQLKAKEILCNKLFPDGLKDGTDLNIISDLVPIFMKFIDSENEEFQQVGIQFVADITFTEPKENTKLLIDSGVIPKIARLLVDSSNPSIQYHCLEAFANTAVSFQQNVIPVIPKIIPFLKSTNEKELYLAVLFFSNCTHDCDESIPAILAVDGVVPLIDILDSNTDNDCKEQALNAITNIVDTPESSHRILELGAFPVIKKLCECLFNTPQKAERKMKLLAIRFIVNASTYSENLVDAVIESNLLPFVLQQIEYGITQGIKIKAIAAIENFVENKPSFITSLIHEHNIIELLYNNLQPKNLTLITSALTVLDNIIEKFENKEFCRQKILECGNPSKFEQFCKSGNEEIAKFSKSILNFVNGVTGATTRSSNDNAAADDNIFESDGISLEAPQNSQKRRKRPSNVEIEGSNKRNKKSRNLELYATSDAGEFDNRDRNFDISSSNNTIVGDQTERSNFEERQSSDNENINEILQRYPRKFSPPSDLDDNPSSRPSSHNSLVLSEVVDSEEDRFQNERKYCPSDDIYDVSSPINTTSTVSELTDGTLNAVQKQFPAPPPIVLSLPPETPQNDETIHQSPSPGIIPSTAAAASRNNNHFAPFKYFYPVEQFISKCCEEHFGLKYNYKLRQKFLDFIKTINIQHVRIDSKPFVSHPSNDETGFGCISMLFTGTEDYSEIIRKKINQKFAYYFSQSDNFDEGKLIEITGQPYMLKSEHLETICRWLECRVMVYCNEKWELYGDWNGKNTPLFRLEKKTIKEKEIYQVVMSVEN